MFLSNLFSRFRKDRRGNVVLMFAGTLMVMSLISAGAIEMHRRSLAAAQMQKAADAAALAGKRQQVVAQSQASLLGKVLTPGAAQAEGEKAAKAVFEAAMAESKNFGTTAITPTLKWNTDGSLSVSVESYYQMVTGTFLPADFAKLGVRATANYATALPTEVAMVLDTTSSMFQKDGRPDTRFTLMRNAAKKFAHQLFNAAQTNNDPNMIRISVIPWATSVNVLGAAPLAADFTGDAPVVSLPDKGSLVQVSSPINQSKDVTFKDSDFAPVKWRGCISGTKEPAAYNVNAGGSPFEPLLVRPAPIVDLDMTEGPLKNTPVYSCTCTSTTEVPCSGGGGGTQGFHRLIEKAVPQISSAAFLFDKGSSKQGAPPVDNAQCFTCTSESCGTTMQKVPDCTGSKVTKVPYCYWYGNYGHRNSYNKVAFACTDQWSGCYEKGKAPKASLTAPACVADPNEPAARSGAVAWCPQYYQTNATMWETQVEIAGPNLNCPMPMLGLSGNRRQVIETLDRLSPVPGGTHADVGLRWGIRSLSDAKKWTTMFGLTKDPATFKSGANKVMVLITDGENEQAVDFPGYWGCNDIAGANAVGCTGSPDAAELDSKMQSWCTAIRDTYGVTIYAVAVNISNVAAVNKLRTCTGDASRVFGVDAADLNAVLGGIAAKVVAMRLTN